VQLGYDDALLIDEPTRMGSTRRDVLDVMPRHHARRSIEALAIGGQIRPSGEVAIMARITRVNNTSDRRIRVLHSGSDACEVGPSAGSPANIDIPDSLDVPGSVGECVQVLADGVYGASAGQWVRTFLLWRLKDQDGVHQISYMRRSDVPGQELTTDANVYPVEGQNTVGDDGVVLTVSNLGEGLEVSKTG
jgi:hypothetical protein